MLLVTPGLLEAPSLLRRLWMRHLPLSDDVVAAFGTLDLNAPPVLDFHEARSLCTKKFINHAGILENDESKTAMAGRTLRRCMSKVVVVLAVALQPSLRHRPELAEQFA